MDSSRVLGAAPKKAAMFSAQSQRPIVQGSETVEVTVRLAVARHVARSRHRACSACSESSESSLARINSSNTRYRPLCFNNSLRAWDLMLVLW